MTAEENESAKARMQAFIAGYAKVMPTTNFDIPFTNSVSVLSAVFDSPPNKTAKASFAFTIPKRYINNPGPGREIHGGAIATFFDNITSTALLACRDYWGQGVSRNMNVTYSRPPREGDRVVIEAKVVQIGRRLVTIQGVMKRESDVVVLAMCLHEKVRLDGGSRAFSL